MKAKIPTEVSVVHNGELRAQNFGRELVFSADLWCNGYYKTLEE